MCNKKKAFVYEIDESRDFVREISRHEDKLISQNIYFQHYQQVQPELLMNTDDLLPEQIIGNVFIHPSAEIHPTAIVSNC